jgi:predicted secreted hydrolase
MAGNNNPESIFDYAVRQTEVFFESIAGLFSEKTGNLRDGTEFEPVVLPGDLFAHSNAQTEWWYYTGHLETESGRQFGFELVFFKRRTDLDRFGPVPLRLLGNPFYFAHFALTDKKSREFHYAHKKSSNGPLDEPAEAAEDQYYLRLGNWVIFDADGSHAIRAQMPDGTSLDAVLIPEKPVVLNGDKGVSFKDEGQASRYFSYTRMRLAGSLFIGGKREAVKGSAWMDREFGTWQPTENQKGWDWFSIQLDNGTELMCYQLRNSAGAVSPYSSGTLVRADGTYENLRNTQFSIEPIGLWKSPQTGTEYPSNWVIRVPEYDIRLRISPCLENQELDTRGTTMIIYWEGACDVAGTIGGTKVRGQAYVELVGYDRSHERPNLAYFLVGRPEELLRKVGIG